MATAYKVKLPQNSVFVVNIVNGLHIERRQRRNRCISQIERHDEKMCIVTLHEVAVYITPLLVIDMAIDAVKILCR